MPEHVHLLLWPPFEMIGERASQTHHGNTQGRIRGILQSIKSPVAKKAIAYLTKHSPAYLRKLRLPHDGKPEHRFWQPGSGYDENVSDTNALHAMIEYIHMNPVRRGLVSRPEEWKWSSAADWLGLPGSPILVDRTLPSKLEIPWQDRRIAGGF